MYFFMKKHELKVMFASFENIVHKLKDISLLYTIQ